MATRSLISLIVDYEIPPHLIIDAINEGRLHPIANPTPALTLEDIDFPLDEVENLFWTYSLKYKFEEERADLIRRFHRYDAIIAALIGAVAGTGATLLAPELLHMTRAAAWRSSRFPSTRARTFEGVNIPQFRIPCDLPEDDFRFDILGTELLIAWWGGVFVYFDLLATADGFRSLEDLAPGAAESDKLVLCHEDGWLTSYEARECKVVTCVPLGQTVSTGDTVMTIGWGLPSKLATVSVRIWRHTSPRTVKPLPLAYLDWPIVPRKSE